MSSSLPPWENIFGLGCSADRAKIDSAQGSLLNVRVSTVLPGHPIGQHISFICIGDDGKTYYCKDDHGPLPIRATEWTASRLADHLGLSVADCAILEGCDGGTYFGSRSPTSFADEHRLGHFLNRAARDETGRPIDWLGQYFSRLHAFDLFIDNPDRNLRNFILDQDGQSARIRAIDFGSAKFLTDCDGNFPIATSHTSRVGRFLRERHGAHSDVAFELLDRISAIPKSVIEGILKEMPNDWLNFDQTGGFFGVWSNGQLRERTAKVRALIEHDWTV